MVKRTDNQQEIGLSPVLTLGTLSLLPTKKRFCFFVCFSTGFTYEHHDQDRKYMCINKYICIYLYLVVKDHLARRVEGAGPLRCGREDSVAASASACDFAEQPLEEVGS